MVEISLSGSGKNPGWITGRGYSTGAQDRIWSGPEATELARETDQVTLTVSRFEAVYAVLARPVVLFSKARNDR
jgi:hypothetical protein